MAAKSSHAQAPLEKKYSNQMRNEYLLKEQFLQEHFHQVDAKTFYSELFCHDFEPAGIDCSKSTGVGNPIVIYAENDTKHVSNKIITQDRKEDFFQDYLHCKFAFVAPCVFYGRRATAKNCRYIYALVVDLDYVYRRHLEALVCQLTTMKDVIRGHEDFVSSRPPMPTFIVNSGTGLHLYYIANEPYPAYPPNRVALKNCKDALIRCCWNNWTSKRIPTQELTRTGRDPRQYSGVTHAYRMIGSLTKLGEGYPVTCYRAGGTWDFEALTECFSDEDLALGITAENCRYKSEMSLDEAQEKYPEWFQRRVVEKQPRNTYTLRPWIYESFKRRVIKEYSIGHRYFCVGMLAVYAMKCGIPKEDVLDELDVIVDIFNAYEGSKENPFLYEEAEKAVENFYQPSYKTFTIKAISRLVGFEIKKNKRNGRSQEKHLALQRLVQDFNDPNGNWRNKEGSFKQARTKSLLIQEWRQAHPNGTKSDCVNDTGFSYHTISKYWGDDELHDKDQIVSRWQQEHPDGNKSECAKDTGLSRVTVKKYWSGS